MHIKLLLSVSTYFVLSHDRVKSVYESQTIGDYHGGRPRKSVQSTPTLVNLILVWLRVLGLITYKHAFNNIKTFLVLLQLLVHVIDLVVYDTPTMLLKRFLKQEYMILLT